jgi:flagellar hook-length control protein FliK
MNDINFSADTVGIQTLDRQTTDVGSDGADAFGIGVFEDMILQILDNNIAINNSDTALTAADTLDGIMQEEDDEKTAPNLLNMLNSDMLAQLAVMYNFQPTEYISADTAAVDTAVDTAEADAIEVSTDVVSGSLQEQPAQADVYKQIVSADDVKYNYDDAVREDNSSYDASVQTPVQKLDTAVELSKSDKTVSEEGVADTDVIRDDFVKAEDNSTKIAVQSEIPRKTEVKTTDTRNNAKSDSDETQKDNKQDISFVSTADMLRLRNGGTVNTESEKTLFKVAEEPIDIESSDAPNDLADKILMRLNDNEFEVELYPKSLGKIAISIVLDNGVAHVTMSSTNDKVNAFLASQSANVQSIIEKNTQYQSVVKVDDSQDNYQQQRDNTQQSADDAQRQRQQEHLQRMYQQSNIQHTENFLSMLKIV